MVKSEVIDKDVMRGGEWIRSFTVNNFTYHTLSGQRWRKILDRCKLDGRTQKLNPTYVGCENGFTDFNEFVEWSRLEFGYDLSDGSKRWALDKDLYSVGNKLYSSETCIFVPSIVNSFTVARTNERGEYPIGVTLVTNPSTYLLSRCSHKGKSHNLGVFHCEKEAHRAWQVSKIRFGRELANEYKSHSKLYTFLNQYVDEIQSDVNEHRETIR